MDKERRKFLKIILISSGALLVGKVLDPLFSRFWDELSTKTDLRDFRIDEVDQILSVYDDSGEEIFQIDKRP